ncbi:hypothetical protein GRI62_11715 [Erythrobacter arachoides]|uniref:Uncharacterized protein n=1 Tax=Aurantiacibacter arachoides TaxID=1850444 RepID=A0A845A4B3_9SPHN|nr:hypothetical protein [Aurantiacibacter arachoides]MXO94262.1 hypothetical protein [Aurantiacibacter arachoides]GGD64867.1 hypothetical protein GCM10011411_26470 [Aurantiacibacter arachoides]
MPGISEQYQAVLGTGRPVAAPLASYGEMLREGAGIALAGLRNTVPKGEDLMLQVSRVAIQPFDALNFSLADVRKVAAKYDKEGYDGLAGARFCSVPEVETKIPLMAMDVVALYFGNPPTKIRRGPRRRFVATDSIERSTALTISLNDQRALRAALAAIFYPPLTRTPTGDLLDDNNDRFIKGGSPMERAFVTLMCRSQVSLKKSLIGFGAGKAVVAGAVGHIEHLQRKGCKGRVEVIHRDLVPHFWHSELKRLGFEHLALPMIRYC